MKITKNTELDKTSLLLCQLSTSFNGEVYKLLDSEKNKIPDWDSELNIDKFDNSLSELSTKKEYSRKELVIHGIRLILAWNQLPE